MAKMAAAGCRAGVHAARLGAAGSTLFEFGNRMKVESG
jgi:hypothetical protein